MRLSIFCVRDYLSIFYMGVFHGLSVLSNPFSGRLIACGNSEFYKNPFCSNVKTMLRPSNVPSMIRLALTLSPIFSTRTLVSL